MKIKYSLIFCIIYFCSTTIYACINTYDFTFSQGIMSQSDAEYHLKNYNTKPKTLEELNDYGVMLIYARRFSEAITVFKSIEKQHPGLAKTAANLGTAYELMGQLEHAKYWINQGILRDPQIHEGSEWIHVKILDAQMQQQKNINWIKTNDVLGLNFGTQKKPKAQIEMVHVSTPHGTKFYDLDQIFTHGEIQMKQRLAFVKQDPITAQIMFNLGNIEVVQIKRDAEVPIFLYSSAKHLQFIDQKLIDQRIAYVEKSKWFHFQQWFFSFRNFVNSYFFST